MKIKKTSIFFCLFIKIVFRNSNEKTFIESLKVKEKEKVNNEFFFDEYCYICDRICNINTF